MNTIQVLDCTLRDGGYCNEWNFGFENTKKIIGGLMEADVEIIECGFITNKTVYNTESTKFTSIEEISKILPKKRRGKIFVAMMNYGEYNIDNLPPYDGLSIDGIRVAFHKKDLVAALEFCKQIRQKGYLVFIQAMISLNYTDEEFLDLIKRANLIDAYAFYIVDSFGMMKEKDLIRLFYMVEHNLKDNISIGFHSHNNMQLAYSNAQTLTSIQTSRNLVIDTSIMGMGRGAGNLNTELFLGHLNENVGTHYEIKHLLSIIDNILSRFYEKHFWGYSLSNYISAAHNTHPNYASYLVAKNTLTFEDMNEIFKMMDDDKRVSYDKAYIEELYLKYQNKSQVQETHLTEFKDMLAGKSVLMIAPGKSSILERDKIISCAKKSDVITISINFDYDKKMTNFVFVSNIRRYRSLPSTIRKKSIVTSNISALDVYLQVRYKDLVNDFDVVKDNAGLMLAKLLLQLKVRKIYIAGMDGYSIDQDDNYADKKMNFYSEKDIIEKKNLGMISVLKEIGKSVDIEFITTPKYIVL